MHERELDAGSSLPLSIDDGPRLGAGLVMLVLGMCLTALALFVGYHFMPGPDADAFDYFGIAFATVFAAAGAGIGVFGYHQLRFRFQATITRQQVEVAQRGWRGTRTWAEPLSGYHGVWSKVYTPQPSSRSTSTHTSHPPVFQVILKHRENHARNVMLFRSLERTNHRAASERFAKLLQLPVLIETGKGQSHNFLKGMGARVRDTTYKQEFEERAVSDLDKSVGEMVSEGKIEIPEAPAGSLKGNATRSLESQEGCAFESNYRLLGLIAGPLILITGVVSLSWFIGGTGVSWQVLVMGVFLVLAGALAIGAALVLRARLDVNAARARVSVVLGGTVIFEREMAAGKIEEVNVLPGIGLQLVSDDQTLLFGVLALSREDDLAFVRNAVLRALARAGSR